MTEIKLKRIIGLFVFLGAAIVYFMTVQPSTSFWDCGEFIASAQGLQVPHPPGTPFFLILGRLFAMIPFADNIGLRVNTISVLSSAFTILFVYLIVIKLIENYKEQKHENLLDSLGTYVAAAVGAFSLAFADTFWFNAVEAEVYALSTFFIAITVWLVMVWNENPDKPGSEKFIIMIFYLFGLATGVHLLSLIAIIPIVMVIFFRKYVNDEDALKKTGYILLGHSAILLVVALGIWYSTTEAVPPTPEEYKAVDIQFISIFGIISLFIIGAFWKRVFSVNSFYMPIMIGGIALVTLYPGMVKYIPNLLSSVGGDNLVLDIALLVGLFALLGFGIYWAKKENKPTTTLVFNSFLFALIGFTTYSMIIIRSNQDTPINLNSPKTFSSLVSYLNREQYGDNPIFKRRYSSEPQHRNIYNNYDNDAEFFIEYQMQHMVNRYILWNYAGRSSTVQDDSYDWTQLMGIPLFFGIFGLIYHFRKDWKMGSIFLTLFLLFGHIMAIYFNSQQPQPRERDYFYVGAFFVFSIWIGIGTRGFFDLILQEIKKPELAKPILSAAMIIMFILIPMNMLSANYFTHDRSRNFVPWDYSYNMLQSVAPNAVIFTNGDNDTFPLWYLQDVEGVRRDVRIANLSLINTGWYVKQLKNNSPYGAAKIKMAMSDEQLDQLSFTRWNSRPESIAVPDDIIAKYGVKDSSIVNNKAINWTLNPTLNFGDVGVLRPQDLVVLDIIKSNQWERPIYWAATTSDDSKLELYDHLQMEGLAFRFVPEKVGDGSINFEVMWDQLMELNVGYSNDYQPGFKYRGLNDPTVFMDDNHIRMAQNYRNAYIRLALKIYNDEQDNAKTLKVLRKMDEVMPRSTITMDYRIKHDIARLLHSLGAMDDYVDYANEIIVAALDQIERNPMDFSGNYNPYALLMTHYENLGQFNKIVDMLLKLKEYIPNDPNMDEMIAKYKKLANLDSPEVDPQIIE
ncbi:MAG: DUF2723 domain-containing protein [Bacteroidetes bacterium]|nr:DUF2723 domain-containing protein [Bacteroidota bacterium]